VKLEIPTLEKDNFSSALCIKNNCKSRTKILEDETSERAGEFEIPTDFTQESLQLCCFLLNL